jgi:hypothetical protein
VLQRLWPAPRSRSARARTRCTSLRVVHYHHMGQSKFRRPFVPSWACLAWFMVQVDARYGMSKRDKS